MAATLEPIFRYLDGLRGRGRPALDDLADFIRFFVQEGLYGPGSPGDCSEFHGHHI